MNRLLPLAVALAVLFLSAMASAQPRSPQAEPDAPESAAPDSRVAQAVERISWIDEARAEDEQRVAFTVHRDRTPELRDLDAAAERSGRTVNTISLEATGELRRVRGQWYLQVNRSVRLPLKHDAQLRALLRERPGHQLVRVHTTQRGTDRRAMLQSYEVLPMAEQGSAR
ncbi:MAG: hypothetical protein AAGF12_42555 [Myxococcota bacterium]